MYINTKKLTEYLEMSLEEYMNDEQSEQQF